MEAKNHKCGEKCSVYGVNIHETVTPTMVRDAMVTCFIEAHKEELEDLKNYGNIENEEEFEKIKLLDVKGIIKNFFHEAGGNFDSPTKESIVRVIDKLVEFSKNFRNQDIIKKHYGEISRLIEKL